MISVSTFSEPGGHEQNEDAFLVWPHPDDRSLLICAVADGQGGRAGGALAAKAACQVCVDEAEKLSARELLKPDSWIDICQSVDQAVAGADEAGFTTLVALCVTDAQVCGASSGDSAAMLFAADGKHQTLTDGQRKNPPIGSGAARIVPFGAKLESPWKLLIVTDSVWKYARWETIAEVTPRANGDDVARELRARAALPRTGQLQDDFTTVLFECE